jgi:hypothetical protein
MVIYNTVQVIFRLPYGSKKYVRYIIFAVAGKCVSIKAIYENETNYR